MGQFPLHGMRRGRAGQREHPHAAHSGDLAPERKKMSQILSEGGGSQGFKPHSKAGRYHPRFPRWLRGEQPAPAAIWLPLLCKGGGQLHFQEIQSAGDSLTTELHFSFPKKKSLQMQSKTLPRPGARRPGGAAAPLPCPASPEVNRCRCGEINTETRVGSGCVFC